MAANICRIAAGRRRLAFSATVGALLQLLPSWTRSARADEPVTRVDVNTTLAPDQSRYDPTDEQLRDAAQMLQKALEASDVKVGQQRVRCLNAYVASLIREPHSLCNCAGRGEAVHTAHRQVQGL